MLWIQFLQFLFNLSDPAVEIALHDSKVVCGFVRIDLDIECSIEKKRTQFEHEGELFVRSTGFIQLSR